MEDSLIIRNDILINASRQQVWDALTNPQQTMKYMFGCQALSDWTPGSLLTWEGEWEGRKMVMVKGNIVDIVAPDHLAYTVIDPNNPNIPDIPENYLTVTYTLTDEHGKSDSYRTDMHRTDNHRTRLTVTQGDYSKVAEGQKRYEESYNHGEGWNPILIAIRNLVESQAANPQA